MAEAKFGKLFCRMPFDECIVSETGDVMAREQLEVAGKEQVLTGLGTATARLREKLGESLASVQRFDVPLAEAIARIAALRIGEPQPRPAPFYLRGADAAPSSDPPPVILP